MRANLALLLLVLVAVAFAGSAPAFAEELFRYGVISCESTSKAVTALDVNGCRGGMDAKEGALFGTCAGTYISNRKTIGFTVSGLMRERPATLPDNDAPLSFDYRGMRCSIETWRLKSVHDCRYFGRGNGIQCSVCLLLGGKKCYDAWVAVEQR